MSETIDLDMRTTADPKSARVLATKLWDSCFRGRHGDSSARDGCWAVQRLLIEQIQGDAQDAWQTAMIHDCTFLALWAHEAFATIETSHKYAAALMCSVAPKDLVEELVLPWKAFVVKLPDGLLSIPEKAAPGGVRVFREIRVAVLPTRALEGDIVLAYMRMTDNFGGCIRTVRRSVVDALFADDEQYLVDKEMEFEPMSPADERAFRCAKRLVFGLLSALVHTDNFRERRYVKAGKSCQRSGPPDHRVVMVGGPIAVDARPAVHSFLHGTRSGTPSVQSLVRGHHKRQVIGTGRLGRRVIWVEPYWRGPEGAPILGRPYSISKPSVPRVYPETAPKQDVSDS